MKSGKHRAMIVLIYLFIIIIQSTGCVNTENNTVTDDNSYVEYQCKKILNQYYLTFDSYHIPSATEETASIADLKFDSLDQIVSAIQNNKFENWQLDIIRASFPKDENGVKIFDLDHLFDPVFPNDFQCNCVFWSGENYSFLLTSGECEIYVRKLNPETFQQHLKTNYTDFFERKQVLLTSTKKPENRDEAKEYNYTTSTGELKKIRYTLPSGAIVDETYRIKMNDKSLKTSAENPYRITIYCETSNICYTIEIFNPKEGFSEEWLNSFLLKERN